MLDGLFKFSGVNFAEGELGFQAGPWLFVFGIVVVLLVVGFGVIYLLTNRITNDRTKAVSLGLRIPALLLLCLPLFEPVLIIPDVVPDENFVAVLVDASASMTLSDGRLADTRSGDVQHLLLEQNMLDELAEHFKLRFYTFSEDATRTDSLAGVEAIGDGTNLSAALSRILDDFRGLPLAGAVLLTDGGDNSLETPLNRAEEFAAREVPLHIVGVGQERFEAERELLEVTVSRGVEETTGAEIDVKVRSWAEETEPVTFSLYRGDTEVFSERQRLKGSGLIDQFTFFYEPKETGAGEYVLRVEEAGGEMNTANNALHALIDMRRDTLRVLYFEGHLRPDFKFIKRALEDDEVVEFTSVSRTGTGKFYRQGLRRPDELEGGFPASEAELFDFEVVIFGDVEAANFSLEQLEMIEAFVRRRGGGFLMLGGRNTFAEGGYWNTPIASLLPTSLDLSRRAVIPPQFGDPEEPPEEQGFRFAPTAAGFENPILKLSPDPSENRSRWAAMPGLTSINYLGAVKPGASVLAEKPEDEFGAREPLLAVQRYGKGRAAALATASTWRWQMLLEAQDNRHERFWRQFARWLAASAAGPVHLDLAGSRFAPKEELSLSVTVADAGYAPISGASVRGLLTDPLGNVQEIAFEEELAEAGQYTARVLPSEEGVYELEVVAGSGGRVVGSDGMSFLVRPSQAEFHDATLKRAFLESLAEKGNGYYYDVDSAGDVPANLRGRRTSTSVYRAEYLWDVPFLFLLVLVLLSAEWIYRRRKGLP